MRYLPVGFLIITMLRVISLKSCFFHTYCISIFIFEEKWKNQNFVNTPLPAP